MAVEKRPVQPIPRYVDGTYQMPSIHLNGGQPWNLYRVKDNDTWISIAQRDGWSNVWDFIDANLRTRDPAEVNWYLGEYIGCKAQDAKNNNYGFSSGASPGLIWTRGYLGPESDHMAAYKVAMAALNFNFDPLFHFRIRGITVMPFLFGRVKTYMARGLIRVRYYDPAQFPEQKSLEMHGDGSYFAKLDSLYLRRVDLTNEAKALVVHEATHAGFDLMGNPMNKAVSEACGYVAQCLYYQLVTGNDLGPAAAAGTAEARVFDAASVIGREIYNAYIHWATKPERKDPEKRSSIWEGYGVPPQYADPLISAVGEYYQGSLDQRAKYDGIPDQYGDR